MRGGLVLILVAAGELAGCNGPGGPPPQDITQAPAQAPASSGASVFASPQNNPDPGSAAEPQPVASLPPGAINPGASGFTTADPLTTHPAYGNAGFGLRRYR